MQCHEMFFYIYKSSLFDFKDIWKTYMLLTPGDKID